MSLRDERTSDIQRAIGSRGNAVDAAWRSGLRRALGLSAMVGLSACGAAYLESRSDRPQDGADAVRSANLAPKYPQPVRDDSLAKPPSSGFSVFGAAAPPPEPDPAEGARPAAEGHDGYTLNFESRPVAEVAEAVLGGILKVGYVVDARAQGAISLASGGAVSKRDLLFVLESALRANNLLLLRDKSVYRIVPANEGALGAVDPVGSKGVEPGYGLTVIPLQYISGVTLARLLEGFAARPGAMRTDPSGRIVLVVGTGAERRAALETVRGFDVDGMRGQSVGMYPVRNGDPGAIVTEIEKIMDLGEGGLGGGLLKFLPVSRLNAILVVSAKPDLLRTAAAWIAQLDSADASGASLHVYKVRHGDAKQIAPLLNDKFLNGAALPGVKIMANGGENTVLIYAGAANYGVIEKTLNQLDRPRAQVAIDVTIAEVTLNEQLDYGVQFYLSNHAGAILNSANPTQGIPATTGSAFPGFNVFIGKGATPQAILNALHALTDVKILSNPSLVVMDEHEARLEVGNQVPVSTGSATVLSANNAVVNTVNYQNTGVILHVLPHVRPDASVLLDISQEISSVLDNSPGLTPTISQRKVTSEISVNNGQMVLLAGMVSDAQTQSRSGVPLVDQLPVVGGAFGTSGKSTARTELIILIRSQIIRDGADASQVAEQLRAKMISSRFDAVTLPAALNVLARPEN